MTTSRAARKQRERRLPAAVSLLRRSERGPDSAPRETTVEEIENWLQGEAMREADLLDLFESFLWRLRAAGIPLERATLHIGTLHPQLFGFLWIWNHDDGYCDEMQVADFALYSDSYKKNPMYRVIEHGETIRANPQKPQEAARFPLLGELAEEGMTDYIAVPLGGCGKYHNAATVATRHPQGFTRDDRRQMHRLFRLFALHVERHIVQRIAGNLLDIYLGRAAGSRVLEGSIKRGSGEAIRAIIWVSDLRGYSRLTGRLSAAELTVVLNAHFECFAGAVAAKGGDVLKFIGDGLLAVFPLADFPDEQSAAEASLAAATDALAALETINAAPPGALGAIEGWKPLRAVVALHEGDVFFGNVGAPERLDFTVIGPAVNEAARVEVLAKEMERGIVLTEPVARKLGTSLDDLGMHCLRGSAEPVRLYAARAS